MNIACRRYIKREHLATPLNGWACAGVLLALIFTSWAAPDHCPAANPEPLSEYQVKIGFIYNFAKFVQWPDTAFSDQAEELRVCFSGENVFGENLQFLNNKSVDSRRLVVEQLEAGKDPSRCRMLFIPAVEWAQQAKLLTSVEALPILTIGDGENFIRDGGMIQLVTVGGHIRFEINLDAAKSAGLKISSKLLQLAERVHSAEREVRP